MLQNFSPECSILFCPHSGIKHISFINFKKVQLSYAFIGLNFKFGNLHLVRDAGELIN
jgi:hypothetical protein